MAAALNVVLDDIAEQAPEIVRSIRAMPPKKFPEHVADSILNGLQVAVDKLAG
tara:strand:- start:6419 stop:6577 length:159 start_codon:yes stop_codon:yes gene_type:complete